MSLRTLSELLAWHRNTYTTMAFPDYVGVSIREAWLTPAQARELGGSANTRVNNASVVTRIDYAGRSILICGDVEASAWDRILGPEAGAGAWLAFVQGVDILVAPHHGHRSGYSKRLLNATHPLVVLASVQGRDPHVSGEYSNRAEVAGLRVNGQTRKLLTTRNDGHIRATVRPALWPGNPGTIRISTRKESPPPTSAEEHDAFVTLLRLASVAEARGR